ncbi:MAG: type II toxin-antitoxin system RelE/ParE family toxin [Vicinamibacteria bacterium]|nr:type II toxin-antitoxin system RelE/ParE family toxin [Vicinamibacteria bacterium]MBP9945211.1 type II toxin-antitoxin system RelE/ParE family toxin [Vicinamibacteria bacterium]
MQRVSVRFFALNSGREPVRDWLLSLRAEDRKVIGDDIRTMQFGWPVGMPLVRKLEADLWEVRVTLASGIARVFFTVLRDEAILLHGFIKKSQKTPLMELETARRRKRALGTS